MGATTHANGKPSEVSAGILCAQDVSRKPSGTVIGGDGRRLTEQCAELWRTGVQGPARQVPSQLTPCDSGHGAVFVYPACPEVCDRLGMRLASDEPSDEDRRFFALRDALVARLGDRCIPFARAEAIARQELTRAGLPGWQVVVGAPAPVGAPPRPCARSTPLPARAR